MVAEDDSAIGVPPSSGPMAAGKSTVARLLAGRFQRGVHPEGLLPAQRRLRTGRDDAARFAGDGRAVAAALSPRCFCHRHYYPAGFTVALEDVVSWAAAGRVPDNDPEPALPCRRAASFMEAVAAREAGRYEAAYTDRAVEQLSRGSRAPCHGSASGSIRPISPQRHVLNPQSPAVVGGRTQVR